MTVTYEKRGWQEWQRRSFFTICRAYEIAQGIMIKETCFGLVIMGKEDEGYRIITEIRKMDPDHIFVKDRGFPPGDARRCRATLGGARPGFRWYRI